MIGERVDSQFSGEFFASGMRRRYGWIPVTRGDTLYHVCGTSEKTTMEEEAIYFYTFQKHLSDCKVRTRILWF